MTPRTVALLALAAVLVAASGAQAQLPPPQVALALDADARAVDANATRIVNATVTYQDTVPGARGTVVVEVDAPEGWVVIVEPTTTFELNAGGSQTVTLVVTAPPAGEGAAEGDALVTAAVTAGPGRAAGTATAAVALARVDPAPPPPPNFMPLYLGLATLVLAGGAGGVAVARRRRAAAERAAFLARETGIALRAEGDPTAFGDRREVAVRLVVRNVSDRPRVALVDVKDVPPEWTAAVNVPRRELKPGEEMLVTLTARPPPHAPLGAKARLVVAAKPEEARERDERVTLDVAAADARGAGPLAPAVLRTRDGAVPKLLRR